jgi:hypothetical protein
LANDGAVISSPSTAGDDVRSSSSDPGRSDIDHRYLARPDTSSRVRGSSYLIQKRASTPDPTPLHPENPCGRVAGSLAVGLSADSLSSAILDPFLEIRPSPISGGLFVMTRRSMRLLLRFCPVVLIGLAPIAGCGDGSGEVDPNIKVEKGKSVEDARNKGGVVKKDAAPAQRKAVGPE